MARIVFVHGMFQNPVSWENWVRYFSAHGYDCVAPAWPLHDGSPQALRANPPAGLGDLHLSQVIASIEQVIGDDKPIVIGHSVGGLIAQLLAAQNKVSLAVGIDSVAPNAMLDFDWGFLSNSATIANPLKGNAPVLMDAKTFHGSFANALSEDLATSEFERTVTHDSRNVLRDCMGADGQIDLKAPHAPLLLIGGETDKIIPAHLSEKNAKAYDSAATYKEFAGRSHYICNEPGWEEVAGFIAGWLEQQARDRPAAPTALDLALQP
jgi:pimeloyl-ACP methyl ester carboxylesterase